MGDLTVQHSVLEEILTMLAIMIIIHITLSVALIAVVLMQSDKGDGLAGAFGGGASSAVFGSRGPSTVMAKITTVLAICFVFSAIGISYFSSQQAGLESAVSSIGSATGIPVESVDIPAELPQPSDLPVTTE